MAVAAAVHATEPKAHALSVLIARRRPVDEASGLQLVCGSVLRTWSSRQLSGLGDGAAEVEGIEVINLAYAARRVHPAEDGLLLDAGRLVAVDVLQ